MHMQMPPGAPGAAAPSPMPPSGGAGAPPGAGGDVAAKMQQTMVGRIDSLNPQEMAALKSIPMEALQVLVGKLLPEMGFVFDMVMEGDQEPMGAEPPMQASPPPQATGQTPDRGFAGMPPERMPQKPQSQRFNQLV